MRAGAQAPSGLYERKDNEDVSQRVEFAPRALRFRARRPRTEGGATDAGRRAHRRIAAADAAPAQRRVLARPDRRGTEGAALAVRCVAQNVLHGEPRRPSSTPSGDAAAQACARIRRHLEQGAPWDACDLFREEIAKHPADAMLLYWGALAHARSGASKRAHALLDQAETAGNATGASGRHPQPARPPVERRAISARPTSPKARTMAERARQEYLAAYAAASMTSTPASTRRRSRCCSATVPRRRHWRREIVARLTAQREPRTFWDDATLGEAQLVLGQFDRAAQSYACRLRAKRRRCRERGHDAAAAAAARARDSAKRPTHCASCLRPTSSRSPAT